MSNASSLAQARMHIESRHKAKAIGVLTSYLTSNPDDAEGFALLARAHFLGEPTKAGNDDAFAAASRAVTLDPQSAFGWRCVALSYSRLDAVSQAREAAKTALNLAPNSWASHVTVATVDATANSITQDARDSVQEALRLAPNHPVVLFTAGYVAQRDGRLNEARDYYHQTLAINPGHEMARNNLAALDVKRGNSGRAAAGFVSLLADNPNSQLALRNLRTTGFRALRVVYLVLLILILAAVLVSEDANSAIQLAGSIIVAVVATITLGGYVLWIRAKAGIYFRRFIRSVPATDKLMTAWAAVLTLCYAAIVATVFAPDQVRPPTYLLISAMLVGTALLVTLVNVSRRTASR